MEDENPQHILAVSGLIRNDSGQVLMVRNPQRGWEIPGGQVEPAESLLQALKREVLEESGVTIRIGPLGGIYSRLNPPHMLLFTFYGQYESGELTTSEESLETEWVARDAVLDRISLPVIHDRVSDLLKFQGQIIYRVYSTYPYTIHAESYLNDLKKWGLG